ncbi:MAG: hypothetical protein NVS2B6_02730 [Thermoleophilaceae bacterium]
MNPAAPLRSASLLIVPAGAGGLVALVASSGRMLPLGALLVAGLVLAFAVWPWAMLPVSIVGGSATMVAGGLPSVSAVVGFHAIVLAAGLVALWMRRLVVPLAARRRTPADLPMAILAALVTLGCAYGAARGNNGHAVLVAGYEIGIVPAYYWLATLTLGEPNARRRALELFLVGAVVLAAAGLAMPGRHGGLISALALLPALLATTSSRSAPMRWLLLASSALLGVDVALSAYRSIWLATGVALLIATVYGTSRARRAVIGTLLLSAVVAIGSLAAGSAGGSRLAVVQSQLHASSGYRLSETVVGLGAFTEHPLTGSGMGQRAPNTYLPNFRVADVGPVYHAFYVTVLANGGALLALALAAAMIPALRLLLNRRRLADALPWVALLAGFLIGAAFAGPTDGHWELGLLPALALTGSGGRRRRSEATQDDPDTIAPVAPELIGEAAAGVKVVAAEHMDEVAAGVKTVAAEHMDEVAAGVKTVAAERIGEVASVAAMTVAPGNLGEVTVLAETIPQIDEVAVRAETIPHIDEVAIRSSQPRDRFGVGATTPPLERGSEIFVPADALDQRGGTPAAGRRRRRGGVHAVVVTYQSRERIGDCLRALAPDVERVVVVDNASSDGTAALVREDFPAVELIANSRNVGFARSVNQ